MREKRFIITAICVYLAYFTHGIQAIVISQLRDQFAAQWNTDLAGVMQVIAWTGVAKFVSVWICGELSDRVGRRPLALIGAAGYVLFFVGLLMSDSLLMACVCAFLAGAATSALDGSFCPALQESFPRAPGSALVALKGFISLSGMAYPLLIGWLVSNGNGWGLALWAPLVCSGLVLALCCIAPFSYDEELKARRAAGDASLKKAAASVPANDFCHGMASRPRFAIEGVCCLLYGFVAMLTFYLVLQSLSIYGKDVIGMDEMPSRALMTYYMVGSMAAVAVGSVIMARGVRPMAVLLIYTAGSLLSLCVMYYIRTPLAVNAAALGVGYFAAGGALQSGLALFGEFFPSKKGRNLGMYYSFMGLAAYAGPAVSSWLLSRLTGGLEVGTQAYRLAEVTGKSQIILFDVGVAAVGVVLMLLVGVRYYQVFGVSPFSLKKSCTLPQKPADSGKSDGERVGPACLEQAR